MLKQLQFEDVKKAALGQDFSDMGMMCGCKGIFGGVAWPGKRPGFAVVVAMDTTKHFDSYDICLLAEFESSSVRDLVRQLGALDFKYSPSRWIGDYKNDAADHFLREMNSELNNGQERRRPRFSLTTTPMLEMEHFYQFALDEIKRLLKEDCRQLFLKDSKVVKYLSEIKESETATLELGDYPAVEALSFAVLSLLDEEKRRERRKRRPLPQQQDMTYHIGMS